jgi:L-threonylcarbamoyladenylate synthase
MRSSGCTRSLKTPQHETAFSPVDPAMKTRTLSCSRDRREQSIAAAARLIRGGELVAFPTETVYGLGANAFDPAALRKIYRVKGRPADNPLIVHIWSRSQAALLADPIPLMFWVLADQFLPGPLTIVMRRAAAVPRSVSSGLSTIALRMPSHPVARMLLKAAAVPIAAPSANLSGRPSPTSAQHVLDDLRGTIAAVLDGGPSRIGVESTVLDITRRTPTILRPGGVSQEMIEEVLHLRIANARANATHPASPGMKYRHYAPTAEVVVYEGEHRGAVIRAIRKAVERKKGQRVGVMAEEEYRHLFPGAEFFSIGTNGITGATKVLYNGFRELDRRRVSIIYCQGFPEKGLGRAFMNRLRKAAGRDIRV